MSRFDTWADMGGYAAFVWPAYGIAGIVLLYMLVSTYRSWRAARRRQDA